MIYYFSGCGNSRWLAENLSHGLNEGLLFIPDCIKNNAYKISDEVVGLVFPIYAWGVPTIVENFVKQMNFLRKPSYLFMACTCGDETGFAHRRLRKLLRKHKKVELNAAFSFVMPETYINLPGFSLDTADNAKRKIEIATEHLNLVIKEIKQRRTVERMDIGTLPYTKSYPIRFLFNHLIITDKKFWVNSDCIACGLCKNVCPTENIKIVDDRPTWHGNCLNCMACYHHCPKNAIHFGKSTKGKGQYYFGKE